MPDSRAELVAHFRKLHGELARAIDSIPYACPDDARELRSQGAFVEKQLDHLIDAIAATGEPSVYQDSNFERAEVLTGVRETLASLALDAGTIEKLLNDDPTPKERHELETIRLQIEATESGLAGIVNRLNKYD